MEFANKRSDGLRGRGVRTCSVRACGQAESCATYLRKGRSLAVDGRLDWREWRDDQGARLIGADPEALPAERIEQLADDIRTRAPAVRDVGMGDPVVGPAGIPHREAVVVLGGEDEVLHPGVSRRGQAGAYSSSVIREGERLQQLLREDGKEIVPFLSGRKGIAYYTFRQREVAQSWSGDSDAPSFARAREIAREIVEELSA